MSSGGPISGSKRGFGRQAPVRARARDPAAGAERRDEAHARVGIDGSAGEQANRCIGDDLDVGADGEGAERHGEQLELALDVAASLDGELDGQGSAQADVGPVVLELLVLVGRALEICLGERQRHVAVGGHLHVVGLVDDLLVERQVEALVEAGVRIGQAGEGQRSRLTWRELVGTLRAAGAEQEEGETGEPEGEAARRAPGCLHRLFLRTWVESLPSPQCSRHAATNARPCEDLAARRQRQTSRRRRPSSYEPGQSGAATGVKIVRIRSSGRANREGWAGSAKTSAKSSGVKARTIRAAKLSRSTRR